MNYEKEELVQGMGYSSQMTAKAQGSPYIKLACEYGCLDMLGASLVPRDKRLQFEPKNSILMTSICPEFRHRSEWLLYSLFMYN